MTIADRPRSPRSPGDDAAAASPDWHARSELDLVGQQLQAVERFTRTMRMREQAAAVATRSRELRMDVARSLEVLRREHDAIIARADQHLRASGDLLRTNAERRVVLAHRSDWLVAKLTQALDAGGVRVVARTDNGADAVGLVVAEQPDLVLVEDTLAMLAGVEVIREIRHFCPGTVVVAQAASGHRVGELLDAGAASVLTRAVPPDDVARSMLRLVGAAA